MDPKATSNSRKKQRVPYDSQNKNNNYKRITWHFQVPNALHRIKILSAPVDAHNGGADVKLLEWAPPNPLQRAIAWSSLHLSLQ